MAEKYESDQIIVNTVITKKELLAAFATLGIKKGMIVYVQSNLERYAYVNGGNETVIAALQEAVGYEGTIVMPAFSEYMVDPACRKDVRIERDLYEDVRDTQLPFHKKRTKSYHALANQLMCVEGVYRSNHPTHSCVSWGKYAKLFCDRHPLHFSLGKDSFLDKLSEMNGFVLLLGVPYKECDIFKYAASLCENQVIQIVTSPIEKKSGLTFMPMLEMEYSSKGVHQVRVMMEEKKIVSECYIDRSHTRFFKAKEAVMLAKAQFSSRK